MKQAKIGKVIADLCDAFAKKDADKLESFHAYGPKFTKFEDDGLGRQDAAAGKKGERDAMAAFKSITAQVSDLKVDVFGQAAVRHLHPDYSGDDGKQKMAAGRPHHAGVRQGGRRLEDCP